MKIDYENQLIVTFNFNSGVKIQKYDSINKEVLRHLRNPTGCQETLSIDVSPSMNILVVNSENVVAVWNYESLKYEGYFKRPNACFGIVKILEPLPIVAVTSQSELEVDLFLV